MNTYLVFLTLATAALSGPVPEGEVDPDENAGANLEYFLVEIEKGVYGIEDLVNSEIDTRASESDVTYHFFSRHDPTRGTTFKSNNINVLKNTEFDGPKETMFIIHGWKDDNESTYNTHMTEVLLQKFDINLFVVDWEPIAGKNYISAKTSVVKVGNYIASFIESLVSTFGLDLSKVSLVGHSLGAHIAGNTGAALGGKIDHIVGLDPAGPLFSQKKVDERLDPTDARFVEVIHTNGGKLGYDKSIGHADYYPNGGSSQPGCTLDITGSCSHARSYAYYSESLISEHNGFIAVKCSSYNDFKRGRCESNGISIMAGYEVDLRATGDYYLNTNSKPLYGLG